MKRFLRLLQILCLGALFVGVTSATTGDLRSWMDNLSSDIPFGYSSAQKISVSTITTSGVTISSPKIQDELGHDILKYTVMYSQSPLSDILENTALLDASKEKTFTFLSVTGTVFFPLTAIADSMLTTGVYYVSVIPKDQANVLGEISNEIWFQMSTLSTGAGLYTGGTHGAGGADMNLANVTHVISGHTITLRRTAVNGSDQVDIFLWNPTTNAFVKLGTANMSDERYSFTATRNGEFIINFMPNNDGREKRYTFTVTGVTGTPAGTGSVTPVIRHVPRVGPTENILVALFIAFVLYLLYRRSTAHRK